MKKGVFFFLLEFSQRNPQVLIDVVNVIYTWDLVSFQSAKIDRVGKNKNC